MLAEESSSDQSSFELYGHVRLYNVSNDVPATSNMEFLDSIVAAEEEPEQDRSETEIKEENSMSATSTGGNVTTDSDCEITAEYYVVVSNVSPDEFLTE